MININLDTTVIVTIITLAFSTIIGPIIAYKIAQKKTKDDFYNKTLQKRYRLVYSSLRILLLETHITGASTGFYFSQRLKRAFPFFKKIKIREGLKRLSKDYDSNPLYEVEFGRDFPMEEIKEIVKKNSAWADAKLLNLVQEADRSEYEAARNNSLDPTHEGLLEKEKFELAEYIWDTYEKLNERLSPKI